MTALLALIFFPEERHILRQWQFQAGTLLGLLGAIGVFWFQPGATAGHVAIRGLLIAFVATVACASQSGFDLFRLFPAGQPL
jgi:uncharacterized membrane protein YccC